MSALQWIRRPFDDSPPVRVAGFVGSFDPPHRGHAWITRYLLERHDRVILLLPAHHLHKVIRPPFNATLEQRGRMLEHIRATCPERIGIAITSEVLYVRLADCLQQEYPTAEIGFGMGDESLAKLDASAEWFARAGLPWGAEEQRRLQELRPRVISFGRTNPGSGAVELPESIRGISSTLVRAKVASLAGEEELRRLVPEGVMRMVRDEGLFISPPS